MEMKRAIERKYLNHDDDDIKEFEILKKFLPPMSKQNCLIH